MPINRYEDKGVADYWNKKYEDEYHPYLHGRQKKVLDLISSLNLPTGSKCLELGTGGGQNAVRYADLGLEVHGVDSSEELLITARSEFSRDNSIQYSNVDLNREMPFADQSFDIVVVVGTLQYLAEPSQCVRDVYRILKPGGFFVVCQRNAISFNVLRRPISFLSCCLSDEGFEWAGRQVSTAVGSAEKGTQAVLIKRMVKASNLRRWLLVAGLEVNQIAGFTPSFTVAPRFFSLIDKFLNLAPFMYRFSHVIVACAHKPGNDT